MKKGKKKYPKKVITHTTKREYFTPKKEKIGHDVKVMEIGPRDRDWETPKYFLYLSLILS